jgi:DivIVA domain-containing protein
MDLDRGKIERTDFASARRGYEPAEVDAHLREVADAVEDLRAELESQAERSSSLSGAASERLRLILDAAEASATEIRSDAEDEARQTVREARREARATTEEAERRASQREEESETATAEQVEKMEARTEELLSRADSLDSELEALLDRMRTAAGGAIEGLRGEAEALRTELEEVSGSSGASGAGTSQRAAVDEEDSDIGDTVIIEPAVGAELSGDEVLLEPEPGPDDVLIEEEELVVVEEEDEEDVFVADEDPGVTTGRSAPQRPARVARPRPPTSRAPA